MGWLVLTLGLKEMGHLLSFIRMIQIILKARLIPFLGRNVPRKPRPSGREVSNIFNRIAFPLAEASFSSAPSPDRPRS
jgi:hypothetical protein